MGVVDKNKLQAYSFNPKETNTHFMRKVVLYLFLYCTMPIALISKQQVYAQHIISGVAFIDANSNEKYDADELPLPSVGISNGVDVVQTNSAGEYCITVQLNQTLFAIKPNGYQGLVNEWNIPAGSLCIPTPIPDGFLREFNFPFYQQNETDQFKVAMLGDLQMRTEEELTYTNRLLTSELSQRKGIAFNVMLGDIADDSLRILSQTKHITKHYQWPTYTVFGNHDRELQVSTEKAFDATFKRNFGSSHYSFNYAGVHFIVINNIAARSKGYTLEVSEAQLKYIRNDLQYVDYNQRVVLMQHAPLEYTRNKEELFALLSKHKNLLAVSGHRHIIEQFTHTISEGISMHEVVVGAVCGLWWDGERDWNGIPHALMGCGAPKGYFIFSFAGSKYTMQYKALEYPDSKQMHIWTWQPNSADFAMTLPEGIQKDDILVNIYAASETTNVEMKVNNGSWQKLEKALVPDPFVTRILNCEKEGIYPTKNQIRSGLKKENSPHIWLGKRPKNLSSGSHIIQIRAHDSYGLHANGRYYFNVWR